MRIGAIVRSVGERTEGLCVEALSRGLKPENLDIVRGVFPFVETLKECYRIARRKGYDWFLTVDADMIVRSDWKGIVKKAINSHCSNKRVWEISFDLRDNITPKTINGLHVINGKFCDVLLKAANNVQNPLRPEQDIRWEVRSNNAKIVQLGKIVIGWHGYEQWRRDLFNRFVVKACRDAGYVKKHKLFKGSLPLTKEQKVAKAGFEYGLENYHRLFDVFDHRFKLTLDTINIKELSKIRFSLDYFYKNNRL